MFYFLKQNSKDFARLIIGFFYFFISLVFSIFNVLNLFKILVSDERKYYAFSYIDAGFRTWYDKIAIDFKEFNRSGYSWDDGIGLSLASRAYNNQITYFLVEKIGQLKLAILGRALWVLFVLVLLIANGEGSVEFLFLFAWLLFFSPLISQIYTILSKPETFWFFLIAPIAYLSFSDKPFFAAILWSLLAFVNAPLAFLVAVTCMLSSFVFQIAHEQYSVFDSIYFVMLCLPGCIKLVLRLNFMVKTKYYAIIGNEQKGLWKRGWLDFTKEWLDYSILALSIYLSVTSSTGLSFWYALVLFLPMFVLSYLNWRIIYLNDIQSFLILFLSYAIGVAISFESFEGLYAAFLYLLKVLYIPYGSDMKTFIRSMNVRKLFLSIWKVFTLSTLLKRSDYKNEPLMRAFSCLPMNSRLVFLTECRLRTSQYRRQIETLRFGLLRKRITQVNDCYGTMQSNDISRLTVESFIKKSNEVEKNDVFSFFKLLQIKYLITFDNVCADILIEGGRFSLKSKFKGESFFNSEGVSVFVLEANFESLDFNIEGDQVEFVSPISGEYILPFSYYSYLQISLENKYDPIPVSEYIVKGKDFSLCKVELVKNMKYKISCRRKLI